MGSSIMGVGRGNQELIISSPALSASIKPKQVWLAKRVISIGILLMIKSKFCRL